jgi:hypothetical protein
MESQYALALSKAGIRSGSIKSPYPTQTCHSWHPTYVFLMHVRSSQYNSGEPHNFHQCEIFFVGRISGAPSDVNNTGTLANSKANQCWKALFLLFQPAIPGYGLPGILFHTPSILILLICSISTTSLLTGKICTPPWWTDVGFNCRGAGITAKVIVRHPELEDHRWNIQGWRVR